MAMLNLTPPEVMTIIRALALYAADNVKNGTMPEIPVRLIGELSHVVEAEDDDAEIVCTTSE